MSKIGQKPVPIPSEVTVKVNQEEIIVSGLKGELKEKLFPELAVKIDKEKIIIERKKDSKKAKSLHGLFRSLVFNMVQGVSKGFEKVLELQGTGYRANLEGENLKLSLGFSHPVIVKPRPGIKFQVEESKIIKVEGINKQQVGQTAAEIRAIREPEPYKGKGIRYQGEKVRRKPGKAAKAGAAAA